MSVVCPTVTAKNADEYKEQLTAISSFAPRVHIDLGDGDFTAKLISPADMYFPETARVDVHLMYKYPERVVHDLIARRPHTVIFHAEAEGDLGACIRELKKHGIKAGIALLQDTTVDSIAEYIKTCDHALVFSGSLGSFGGTVDFSLLQKVHDIRRLHPDIEIGWDGGISTGNIARLAEGGVDVLNVGGAIQRANHPENAYRDLTRLL